MAVVMLLKNKRFSQKASLRRKEVRKRAWARSALKLAKVMTDSLRVLGFLQIAPSPPQRNRPARAEVTTVTRAKARPRGGPDQMREHLIGAARERLTRTQAKCLK